MAAGDEQALRELYDLTYNRLWDFARSVGGTRDRADELVQEAFVLLWERAAEWDDRSHVRGFLYLAVRNLAKNRARRERVVVRGERGSAAEIALGSMANTPRLPDADMAYRELIDAVLVAIAELPEPRRTALVLRWREELPYEEIGRILGTSAALARQLVARARATLRVRVGPLFGE